MHDGKIAEKVSRSILKVGVIVLVLIMLTALFETAVIATASADTFTTPADEALYIERVQFNTAADNTGDIKNITTKIQDDNLVTSFKIEPAPPAKDYKVITMKSDNDPSDYSKIVLHMYVTNYQAPASVMIYAYQFDENNVNTSTYMDYGVSNTGWNEWDVTNIAHSMDDYGQMKFRVVSTSKKMWISEGRFSLTPIEDITPPASVTNLINITYEQTYINWIWNNPPDPDFSHVMVYLDGNLKLNTSEEYYNATGLDPETSHEISTRTVDTSGNINATWVNHTATTAPIPNAPPVLDPIGDKTVDEGSLLEFTVTASDPDGDPLTYSAFNLPVGATFDSITRTFSWTPTYEQAGSYPDVCFEVSDGSLTDSENVTITVNDVDIIPPNVTINTPTPDWYNANFVVNATVTDNVGVNTVQFRLENISAQGIWQPMTHQAGTDYWTATFDISTVIDGNYTIRVNATDDSTNEGTQTVVDIGVDTTPPMVSDLTPADSSYVTTATPTISATLSDVTSGINIASVVIKVDTVDVTLDATVTETSVSYTPAALSQGSHSVTVDVNDNAGNSATQASWSFTVDTVYPEITINPVTTPTSVDTQTITGTYTEANLATIVVDGVNATITDGSWSATVSLSEGSNTITATATDQVDHTATATDTIVLDTAAPTISVLTPADGDYVDTATPLISATISDADPSSGIDEASIVMTVDGLSVTHAYDAVTGVVSYIPAELLDGIRPVTVTVSDNAGNPATASWSFTVDTVDPAVTIDEVDTPTNVATQTITGTYVEVNLDTIDVNGVEATVDPAGTYSAIVNLVEGPNPITVTATDLAGNDGTAETTIFLDTEAPTFIVSASPDPATTGPVTITVTASEALSAAPTVTVTPYLGTPTTVTMTLSTGTTYTGTYTVVTGYDGVATIGVSGTDLAGNTGTGTGSFVVDTTPPPIPTMDAEPAYTIGTSNILSWEAVVDAGVGGEEYYVECDVTLAFGTEDLAFSGWITGTSYEFTGLTDGVTYYYHVKSRDAFEQESAWSDAVWSTQDDSAPTTADDASPDWTNLDVTVALTATDVGSGVFETYYTTDGSDPVTSTTRTLYTAPFILTETGQYQLKYYSVDSVGNAETVVTGTLVKIDKVVPSTSDDVPADWQNSPFTIALTVTDTGGSPTMTYYKIWSTGDVEPTSYTEGTTIPVTVAGEYYVKYYTSDEAGNEETAKTATNTTKLDTIAPTGTILINDDATYTTSVNVILTLSASDDTSGVAEMCFSNDGVTYTDWEAYATSKSLALTTGDGAKTVYVKYRDNAGLESTPYSDDIILDTTPPTISDLTPLPDSYIATATPTISAILADATPSSAINAGSIVMTVDGAPVAHAYDSITGVVSYTPSELAPLAQGTRPVTVDVSDNAGNTATASWSFIVDTVDPVVTIDPVDTPTNVPTQAITGTYVDVNLDTIDVNGVEATVDPAGIYSAIVNLVEGSNTITVTAVDLAGNVGTNTTAIVLDTTPPTITNLQPADGETVYEHNVTVCALLSDAGSGIDTETIVVKIDGVELSYDINRTNDGMKVFIISERRWLTEGNHSVTINVSDKMNRANQTTWSFTVKATYYEIALELGWNLISLPLIPENSSIEAVLEGVPNVVSVWTYDAATGNWYVYSPVDATNTMTEMKDGPGYWVMMDRSARLIVRGVTMYPGGEQVPPSYPVYEGWNLIGFKSTEEMAAEEYLASVWSLFEKPWTYPLVYYPGDKFYSVEYMEPGYGYWLYMVADGVIIPPASQREEKV